MSDKTIAYIGIVLQILAYAGFIYSNIRLQRRLKEMESENSGLQNTIDAQHENIIGLTEQLYSSREKIESYKEKEKRLREIIAEIKQQNTREVIAYEKLLSLIEAQQKSMDAISKVIEQLKVNQ